MMMKALAMPIKLFHDHLKGKIWFSLIEPVDEAI